ncbi:hypothetical protein TNCV_1800171 [Trichonephila clavipes]|nr:hypothetical protein TNCV_1800171 [Trichonephila clavipes]
MCSGDAWMAEHLTQVGKTLFPSLKVKIRRWPLRKRVLQFASTWRGGVLGRHGRKVALFSPSMTYSDNTIEQSNPAAAFRILFIPRRVWSSKTRLGKIDSAFQPFSESINEYQASLGTKYNWVSRQTDHLTETAAHTLQRPRRSFGAVDSLVVRASDSRPEGLGSMPNATKYPPSTHGVTCSLNQWIRSLVG